MSERYTVRVTKDYLVFCSGHLITYDGTECERLHGHNYRAAVEVDAPLDTNHYVFDFVALKNIMRRMTDEIDHYLLVPMKSKLIAVEVTEKRVRLTFGEKEWIVPRADCVLLPVENTTAELLAKYLADRLRDELSDAHRFVPEAVRVEVEESFGQTARYEWRR